MPNPTQRRKIAFLLPDLEGGGAERVALAQIDELLRRGHEVHLLLAFHGGVLLSVLPPEVRLVEFNSTRLALVLLPLMRYLRAERPFSLHAFMWPLTVFAAIGCKLGNPVTRVMLSDHVALSRQVTRPGPRLLLRLTTAAFYRLADILICVSKDAARDLKDLAHLPLNRIRVIYNPIKFPDAITNDEQISSLWGGASRRLLSVGTLKDQKNHANLLRAFAKSDHRDAKLVILGEGPLRPALERLATDLGIADKVEFPGFVLDPWPFYAAANLFVLSSDYEGFANVIAEALYAGLRVVSTDCVAGPREILDNGRFGTLVPVGSVDELAAAIDQAFGQEVDPDRARARAIEIAGKSQVERYADLLVG